MSATSISPTLTCARWSRDVWPNQSLRCRTFICLSSAKSTSYSPCERLVAYEYLLWRFSTIWSMHTYITLGLEKRSWCHRFCEWLGHQKCGAGVARHSTSGFSLECCYSVCSGRTGQGWHFSCGESGHSFRWSCLYDVHIVNIVCWYLMRRSRAWVWIIKFFCILWLRD